MKYISYVREHFKDPGFPVVRLYEIRTVLKLKGISDGYLKRMINYLLGKGELKRITSGIYTLHDDIMVAGFAFQPFYYGLESALTIRKLWEQGTNPVVMTTRKVRQGMRTFDNSNYLVKHVRRRLFFGYELVRYYDFWIPVSDIEKTLIDLVYFGRHVRADVIAQLKRDADRTRLRKYLEAYNQSIRDKVWELMK